ncbi:MAG: hypothetical protein QOK16_2120 [Solirubrobacteraceae bacterium]|jgi:hypothetical protein|nr:hypothetical protein [Solirubrobacteraceae bacterium]
MRRRGDAGYRVLMAVIAVSVAAATALALAWLTGVRRLRKGASRMARAVLVDPDQHTTMDERGAVRSVQAADVTLPLRVLEEIWTPMHLERLARTYWRYLTRWTLGLIRVKYEEDERAVVFLMRPFVLLRFRAPEYELDAWRGIVRWRIASGLLVSRTGRDGDGYLQIDVRRCKRVDPETGRVHIEVEVANFYPALASAIARWFYTATQSRIHVIVTHGFLRSLARLDLARSVVGRYETPADADAVPDPPPLSQPARPSAADNAEGPSPEQTAA